MRIENDYLKQELDSKNDEIEVKNDVVLENNNLISNIELNQTQIYKLKGSINKLNSRIERHNKNKQIFQQALDFTLSKCEQLTKENTVNYQRFTNLNEKYAISKEQTKNLIKENQKLLNDVKMKDDCLNKLEDEILDLKSRDTNLEDQLLN